MKIARKLPFGLGVALTIMLVAALFGLWRMNGSIAELTGPIAEAVENERRADAVFLEFRGQVQEWKNVLLRGGDAEALKKHWGAFEKAEGQVASRSAALRDRLSPGPARESLEQFIASHVELGRRYRQGLEAYRAAAADPRVGDRAVAGVDREPLKLIDKVSDILQTESAAASEAAAAAAARALWISLAVMGLVTLAALAAGVWFARGIARPLAQAVGAARQVANGDLAAPLPPATADEVGELITALGDMQASLSRVVGTVRDNAGSVAIASAQIAQGNADLSQRTEEQASALEESASSMEQLGSTVKHNAENASAAEQLAREANAAAHRGGEMFGRVVETMEGISDSSRRIAEIIGTIDGIAFQTNILALNAAVEAARAGEQGRGFAVVAGEVRNLAQRSAEAAREIKSLIGTSVERVEQGRTLVADSSGTIEQIVQSINRVADVIAEISVASREQSDGIAQVGEAITQIDHTTQQNAALVEQSAAAAESLKAQAARLTEAIAVFRTQGAAPLATAAERVPAPAPVAAPKPAPSPARWVGQERRSPARATNVTRLPAKPIAVPAAASGTDDWETF